MLVCRTKSPDLIWDTSSTQSAQYTETAVQMPQKDSLVEWNNEKGAVQTSA